MKISQHASKRLKERCGLQKKSQDRMAQKALTDGITHAQTKGRLNRWITKLYFKNPSVNNMRLYGEQIYLFADETLVTVMQIPNELKKDLKEMVKER